LKVNSPIEKRSYHSKQKTMERDYNAVAEEIKRILPQPHYDDGSAGPLLVRFAWHCSGTYDKHTDTGGSNGATMRFQPEISDSENRGMDVAKAFLEPVKEKFPWISYADLWTLGGAVAVEALGGPKIEWKPGRIDYENDVDVPPQGRLPYGHDKPAQLRDKFYRMGFNDQEIVALSGAHVLGRCHTERSGYDGKWVDEPTVFSNDFFDDLTTSQWFWQKSPAEKYQFYDDEQDQMMLPSDMALLQDDEFKYWAHTYAKDQKLFFDHFAKAFSKLLELGVHRDSNGTARVNKFSKNNL
jgi:cytochrome c peroxidase